MFLSLSLSLCLPKHPSSLILFLTGSIVIPFSPPPAPPNGACPSLEERQAEWAPRVSPVDALRIRHAVLVDLRKPKEYGLFFTCF